MNVLRKSSYATSTVAIRDDHLTASFAHKVKQDIKQIFSRQATKKFILFSRRNVFFRRLLNKNKTVG
jgi:hypothetical protein